MLGNNSEYALSECIREYYSDRSKFYRRYQYFKPIIGYEYWNVIDIKENILKHFSPVLKLKFAEDADKYPDADDMTAFALALNILYWGKKTGIIS